jgi:hypothetical protein
MGEGWMGGVGLHSVEVDPGAHPASPSVLGRTGISLELKRAEQEASHSPPSSADVNGGAIPPLLHTFS